MRPRADVDPADLRAAQRLARTLGVPGGRVAVANDGRAWILSARVPGGAAFVARGRELDDAVGTLCHALADAAARRRGGR